MSVFFSDEDAVFVDEGVDSSEAPALCRLDDGEAVSDSAGTETPNPGLPIAADEDTVSGVTVGDEDPSGNAVRNGDGIAFDEGEDGHAFPTPADQRDVLDALENVDTLSLIEDAYNRSIESAVAISFGVLPQLKALREYFPDTAGLSPRALKFVNSLDKCINDLRKHSHEVCIGINDTERLFQTYFKALSNRTHNPSPSDSSCD